MPRLHTNVITMESIPRRYAFRRSRSATPSGAKPKNTIYDSRSLSKWLNQNKTVYPNNMQEISALNMESIRSIARPTSREAENEKERKAKLRKQFHRLMAKLAYLQHVRDTIFERIEQITKKIDKLKRKYRNF